MCLVPYIYPSLFKLSAKLYIDTQACSHDCFTYPVRFIFILFLIHLCICDINGNKVMFRPVSRFVWGMKKKHNKNNLSIIRISTNIWLWLRFVTAVYLEASIILCLDEIESGSI